jgi:SAM-dependent methyltransferase
VTDSNRSYCYPGDELSLFSHAQNWKAYFNKQLRPYIRGRVAEIGAGNGGTTEVLSINRHEIWYAVEPDGALLAEISQKKAGGLLPKTIVEVNGTIKSLGIAESVDTVLYIDVLEHIEDDRQEICQAALQLRCGGNLIVLAPAYQSLFSAFDSAIGHYRRYSLPQLRALTPPALVFRSGFYLDCVGACTSMVNRFFLHKQYPALSEIRFWDRYLIPCSVLIDRMIGHRIGRSVVAVWERQ